MICTCACPKVNGTEKYSKVSKYQRNAVELKKPKIVYQVIGSLLIVA